MEHLAASQQLRAFLSQHPSHLVHDPEAMEQLGSTIGQHCAPGVTLALLGPLGAGKTTFVQGLVASWCPFDQHLVASPSFALLHQYGANERPFLHLDLYRLAEQDPALPYELGEHLHEHHGLAAVEWAQLAPTILPTATIWLEFDVQEAQARVVRYLPTAPC